MKKLNTTYLDNLVSKILKETLEEKADSLVSKIKGGNVCECGGTMYEGECNECGNMYEDMSEGIYDVEDTLDDKFDYVEENTDEDRMKTCKYHIENFKKGDPIIKEMCQGVNINEALKGRQRNLDRNKNNKIDAEDFKMLRNGKKSETDEGNAFTGALSKARKTGEDDFEVDGKKFETKEDKLRDLTNNKNTHKDVFVGKGVKFGKKIKESYSLTETEMISLIEKIVNEEKDKTNIKVVGGSPKGLEKYKQIHAKDGKENDDNIKAVAKKMKEYLKDGSKGDYDMNPKMFPKGNGELEKMKKKAYTMSDEGKDFIDDFMSPGMENLDYDQIDPNEEQITANIEGSSKTGNDSSYANAIETDVNKKINAKRKANKFAKARNMAYQKAAQPIKDATGEDKGTGLNIKLESTEDKKTKQINEEFDRMKSLIGYNRKTQ
jgi:hypothetical protein